MVNKQKQIFTVWREAQTPTKTAIFHLEPPGLGFFFLKKIILNTMSHINFSVILILGLMSTMAHSMRFDLQSGATKCISDDIKSNAMTVGKYSVVNHNEGFPKPDSHKVTVRVIPKPALYVGLFLFLNSSKNIIWVSFIANSIIGFSI